MNYLINIKNKDINCFICCHIRHLNPLIVQPETMTKTNERMVNDVDYVDINFPASTKDYSRIGKKNNICINVLWKWFGLSGSCMR